MNFFRLTPSRIFLFLLVSFIAGVAARSFFVFPVFALFLVFLSGVIIIALGILKKKKEAIIFGFFVAAFAFGIFRYGEVHRAPPTLSQLYGKHIVAEAVVVKNPEMTARSQRLVVRVAKVNNRNVNQEFLTLVSVRRFPEYAFGDELAISGVIEYPENFGEFDYAAYLAKDDITTVMAFPDIEKIGSGKAGALKLFLSRAKHAFEANIDRSLPDPHAAFLKGLTVGERESLPADLVENFTRTGTTHIVALSGYNITLVARFFVTALLFLALPFRVAFWVASAGVILFVLLTGASPSIVRAGIMGILALVANREGRVYQITNALVFAAAAMIFVNPKILRFDAAFQLSFLATVGLVYLSPRVNARLDRIRDRLYLLLWRQRVMPAPEEKRKQARDEKHAWFPFRQTFVETLAAQLMVLPLLIYLFGRVSIVSPVANLFILIAVPYAMAFGFAAGAFGFIWRPLALTAGWITWMFLEYQIRIIAMFASLPASSVEVGKWMAFFIAFLYGVVFLRMKLRNKSSASR